MIDDNQYSHVDLPLTEDASVTYSGFYRRIAWEVHYFRMETGSPTAVCSYVNLTEVQFET